jgi:beta-glucuronidase
MEKRSDNFVGAIHTEDFEAEYLENLITSKSMVYDSGREKELLNGWWHFGIDQYDTCLRSKWYEEKYRDEEGRYNPVDFSFEDWEKMYVPSCWNMHREKLFLYEGSIVYTRTFKYFCKGEKRVFIKFGAANYNAKVFLNKEYLGCHKGGSSPFYVEATGLLKEVNRIIVVVNNTRKRSNVPCENTDWFNYGGLYRDIEIIRLPETFIRDFSISLVPDSDFSKIQASITVEGTESDGIASLKINELNVECVIDVSGGNGSTVIAARPELWSPETPKLYDVVLSYGKDVICEKIGFREIKAAGQNIYLNGKEIFLKGICAHEESVINGKAVREDEIRENFRLAKEMNCNFMRLAHYPHTEKAAQIADEMGILLWEEIPVYWAIDFQNKDTYRDAENQLTELIMRDKNRASVIVWSVGNENADTEQRLTFMRSLVRKAKKLDPARLVSAACLLDHVNHIINDRLAEYLDIIGANQYYGWYQTDFDNLVWLFDNSKPAKPVVITEFGAGAKPGHRGTVDEKGTEDCQFDIYKKQVEVLGKIPYVKGTSPWILFDFRCPRRLHFTQGYYNVKGLLSADKKYRKPAFYVMQEFYKKM